MKFSRFFAPVWTAAAMLLSGCACAPDPGNDKLTVTLAVNDIYCKDSACSCVSHVAARTYGELQRALSAEHNIRLELVYFEEPYELEKAVRNGKFDGVICKPWFAVYSAGPNRSFTRIADVLGPDNNQWLTGIVIVSAGSKFRKLGDLNGKNVVIGQADAYEKYHAALRVLSQAGVKPGKIYQKASCSESIGEVMTGQAAAAVISDYALTADCAVDFTKPENFRVLATTEKIPLTSVLLDPEKVSPATARRLQQALLAVSGDKMPKSFLSNGFVKPAAWAPPELKLPEQ